MKRKTDSEILHWINEVTGNKKIYIGVLLLVQIIIAVFGVSYALILRNIIDAAVAGSKKTFFLLMVVFAGIVLSQIILRAVIRYVEEYSRATMENCFKERFFSFLLENDFEKISAVHSGEWMNRLTSDTIVVADGLAQIIPGAAGMFVKMFGALCMILILEPCFGYLFIPGGVVLVVLTYCFRKQLKKLHKKVQEADGNVRIFLQEGLSAMLVIRAFVREKEMLSDAVVKMEIHKKTRMKKNWFSNVCNIGFGGIMHGAYVVGAGLCGCGILKGTMTYGTLMAILQLISQIQAPFANITGYLPKYYAMIASAERLMEVEREAILEQTVISFKEIKSFYQNSFAEICLEHAEFTYQPTYVEEHITSPIVLNDLNLLIRKGDYVALTGPSGCGKSTVLKLLMSLYHLAAGECWIDMNDGIIRKQLDVSYRRLFAYVPQGNHLMSGTIREIIAFYDREGMQQEEKIWHALQIACGNDFVMELPLGIDTVLGERGLGLSEGQMQRIAIARAVFSDNPILMLDESTSALDEKTEKQMLLNLRKMTDKTVLIVTHRRAVLSICDWEIRFTADCVIQTEMHHS